MVSSFLSAIGVMTLKVWYYGYNAEIYVINTAGTNAKMVVSIWSDRRAFFL
jgi:hypothetical protein